MGTILERPKGPSPGGRRVTRTLCALTTLSIARPGKRSRLDHELEEFYELGEKLIMPIWKYLAGTRLLYIVPHKDLHRIPFHALKVDRDGRNVHLCEAFEIMYLPSASVLKFCQERNPHRHGRFAIEHPLVLGTWAEGDGEDCMTSFQSEMMEVSGLLGSQAVQGLAAHKGKFLECVSRHDLTHLTCHGYFFNSADVMSSCGLLLNDGKKYAVKPDKKRFSQTIESDSFVSAKELLKLRLRCHLVTLSGCETGLSESMAGDELLGLSRALLYAGTPSVLLSLWPVHSGSKAALVSSFYRIWLSGMGKGKAKTLQEAQMELLSSDRYDSVYHWGGYCMIGDWL